MNSLFDLFRSLFSPEQKPVPLDELHGIHLADALFQNLVVEQRIPGVGVTIHRHGEMLLQKGYGFANLESGMHIDPAQSIFRIASISKCITGIALGKMLEDGLVDLDASFYKYVPYYPQKKHDFTLRQLASHTAGIRGYRGKEFALNTPNSIKDSIVVFKDDPLVFVPGKGYLYNSFGFVLLSLAMQEASQVPFEVYVRERILEPLGMKNTFAPSLNQNSAEIAHIAHFYTKTAVKFKEAATVNNFYKLAGGGFLSTCEDIARMGQAVLSGELLQKSTYEEIFTSQIVNGKPTYYGLGFQVSEDAKGRKFIGHVGNSVGAYTNFLVYPEEEMVVSVLINCTDPKIQVELDKAFDAILDLPSS